MLKSPDRNDLDPYNRQYDVAIDLSSKLLRYKLISILVKICDVVYVQITNISLASRLMSRSRLLTAVTSHRLVWEIRHTLSSVIILYMHLNGFEPHPRQLPCRDLEKVLRTQLFCNTTASAPPRRVSALLRGVQ